MAIWKKVLQATLFKLNTILQNGNPKMGLLIDSGNVRSILNESFAEEFVNNSYLARWLTTTPLKNLKTFANEPIPVIG